MLVGQCKKPILSIDYDAKVMELLVHDQWC